MKKHLILISFALLVLVSFAPDLYADTLSFSTRNGQENEDKQQTRRRTLIEMDETEANEYIYDRATQKIAFLKNKAIDLQTRSFRDSSHYIFGAIPLSGGISPSGAKTYTVPIECAPDSRRVPSVALYYNSQAGNGVAGYDHDNEWYENWANRLAKKHFTMDRRNTKWDEKNFPTQHKRDWYDYVTYAIYFWWLFPIIL